jgi:ribulose-phosphate 3-epimerase
MLLSESMPKWSDLPHNCLLADVSLWSADLPNLQRSIERMEPYADSFHIDVLDDRFAPGLLFFPDLVNVLRPLSARPFHVHLIAEQPSRLMEAFTAAGCDLFTMQLEAGASELEKCFDHVRASGREAGVALRLDTPVGGVEDFLDEVVAVLLMGTASGIKGAGLSEDACDRITELSELLKSRGLRDKVRIVADGGIRRNTVPQLRQAGADAIVPGSLAFGAQDLNEVFAWMRRQ